MAASAKSTSSRPRALCIVAALLVTAALVGCPRRFDAAATPDIVSSDASANEHFRAARELVQRGQLERADSALTSFIAQHRGDPLIPLATLYLADVKRRRGEAGTARELLVPLARSGGAAEPVAELARFRLGLLEVQLGANAAGRKRLLAFVPRATDESLPALLAALAHASEALADDAAALRYYDRLHAVSQRPTEKTFARRRMQALLSKQRARDALQAIYRAAQADGLLAALAAERLLDVALAANDRVTAERLRRETEALRVAHGLAPQNATGEAGGPVALLLPFSGPYRAVGRLVLAGGAAGSGAFGPTPALQTELLIRDSSSGAAEVARRLIEQQHVVALVGTLAPETADAVSRVAAAAGVPFLSLALGGGSEAGNTTFRMLPDGSDRAKELARRAVSPGQRVAVLAPHNDYGDAMAAAFADEAKLRRGRMVAQLRYPPRSRSFAHIAEQLAATQPDVVFVPDSASRLALVAPALALAGLWSTPPGGKPIKGRAVALLATADGLTPRLLTSAGRYLQGALVAPGFYGATAEANGPAASYRQIQGHTPELVEAFAHDAVGAVRQALASGARGRSGLMVTLKQGGAPGLTGLVRFGADRRRADPPLVYRVAGEAIALATAP